MSSTEAKVLQEVAPVAQRFVDAGFSIYLVGGIVRDLQLGAGLEDLDFDLTTDARPDDIKRILSPVADAIWTQGERFGTIGAQIAGREYEITTHRAEWYAHESRKPDVEFGDDVVADLSRRDFTVNAMAIQVPDGELIDPFDGRVALGDGVLVTPIEPEVSFKDDPLRILRAGRFIARHGFTPSAPLVAAATAVAERMSIVSAERVRDELDKILIAPTPSSGVRFLIDVGAFDAVLPLGDVDTDALMSALDGAVSDLHVRRGVVFASLSADNRLTAIQNLRYSNADQRHLRQLMDGLEQLRRRTSWSAEDLRRLVDRVGYDNVEQLFDLAAVFDVGVAARAAFDTLDNSEDLRSFDPVLGGNAVMTELGIEPGPAVGNAMNVLRERRLVAGPATADEELEFLRAQRGH
ncbi:MAG: CCA tRNA nucleotidyltransferase [Acidimicrobiales bacterium]|nr:CCA tRNA nucleotidyltransferase [Acidimicrobiales bacterium]